MAATYTSLPISLSKVLESIVSDCSDALIDDIGAAINFKADSFLKIMSELVEESKTDPIRYPLFALLQPYQSKLGDYNGSDITCDILIANLSDPHKNWEQREDGNYTPILLPIYSEFMTRLGLEGAIEYEGRTPDHKMIKLYHLGDVKGGHNGYIIPDVIDAILIEGLSFRLDGSQTCIGLTVPCEQYHEAQLVDYMNTLSVSESNGNLIIGLAAATFISLLPGGPVEYMVDFGYGSGSVKLEILTPLDFDYTVLSAGTYIGTITSSYGSQMQFEYTVADNGQVKSISSIVYMNTLSLDYNDLDCTDKSNYPIEIGYRVVSTSQYFSNVGIKTANGTLVYSETYGTTLDATDTYTGGRLTTMNELYQVNVTTRNNNILTNKITLQIKTI